MKQSNKKNYKEIFARLIKLLRKVPQEKIPQITTTVTSIASVVLAIFANYLYDIIKTCIAQDAPPGIKIVVLSIILIIAIYKLSGKLEKIKIVIWPEYKDDQYMRHAFLHLKKLGSLRQKSLQELQVELGKCVNADDFMIREAVHNMQLIVESCYSFFDSAFSKTGQLVDDIKFEATFMTKSYIDGEITIPCSANKECRTPISMHIRKDNPQVYNTTETARIYHQERPTMILVSDTESEKEYKETYANQKQRIKSTVILPVLSHRNTLLGTLVVHCNRANFFKEERYNFWNELLEMFAVELGYQKLLLDYYIVQKPDIDKPF